MKKFLWVLALVMCGLMFSQKSLDACSYAPSGISWPQDGAEEVVLNPKIEIISWLSEDVKIYLRESGVSDIGEKLIPTNDNIYDNVLYFVSSSNLKPYAQYVIQMDEGYDTVGISSFTTGSSPDLTPPDISEVELAVDIDWIAENEEVELFLGASCGPQHYIVEDIIGSNWLSEEDLIDKYLPEHYHVSVHFNGVIEDSDIVFVETMNEYEEAVKSRNSFYKTINASEVSGVEKFVFSFEDRFGNIQSKELELYIDFNQVNTTYSFTKIEDEDDAAEGFGINSTGCSFSNSVSSNRRTIIAMSILLVSLVALSVVRLTKSKTRSTGGCMKRYFLFFLMSLFLVSACDGSKISTQDNPPPIGKEGVLKTQPIDLSMSTSEMVSKYQLDGLDVKLQVPQYNLPIKTTEIANYQDFTSKLSLSDAASTMVVKNGFVVMENSFNPKEEDITDPYKTIKDKELPVFITADSLLHLYHIQFDETLRIIEEEKFYDMIWDISKGMVDYLVGKYNSAINIREKDAIKMAIAYFSVPLEIMTVKEADVCEQYDYECKKFQSNSDDIHKYKFDVPSMVDAEVSQEIALMDAHQGFSVSPLFKYEEDYSQYVPRGHYTRSLKLEKYFRSLMWFGRMTFLLKGCDICIVSEKEARLQTKTALIITKLMENNPEWFEAWRKIYEVTAFYVGFSDDLGPNQYKDVSNAIFSGDFLTTGISVKSLDKVLKRLAAMPKPKINGGTGNCTIDITEDTPVEQAQECLSGSAGFRFMGQRFIPDSYMFSNLVYPYVDVFEGSALAFTTIKTVAGEIRGFPRGLDVLAVLGSGNAQSWLFKLNDSLYKKYDDVFTDLKTEFDSLTDEEWNQNLYWSWLFALKSFMKSYSAGYPTFMQTSAWLDKTMNTTLASWAELRHDTILYAKQSYGFTTTAAPGGGGAATPVKPVVGYVEPVPEFYNRLLSMSNMIKRGLLSFQLFETSDSAIGRLDSLSDILEKLRDISINELENRELTQEDYDFIKNFGKELNGVISEVDDDSKKTTIIGDVHTDGNTKQVLEEGVGYVKLIVVAYKVPDGRVLMGVGPVMSYYEFKHPMNDRLTDEKWREMLEANPPSEPEWTMTYDDDLSEFIAD